ncbi:MAG: TIGR00730 family Rossman fold protein [Phreatobacter sp.]|uniref:LOG family protein n=1 Tax=Phreatobacter sp. TaxID=1966341 RepID=UPI0027365A8C|nr:TIGR00730 family Rossman fold protein [Phreatobacter sp.]MDP2804160.1 TIGR00730 family Rossman fold protein [Phreatobacter sp.]
MPPSIPFGVPNAEQRSSTSFRLPALDQDFLLADEQRGLRFMLEYAKAEQILRRWAVKSTIVVFGSARVRETGNPRHAAWYGAARAFGSLASQHGGAMNLGAQERENVITTGGGPGLMEAANRGAADIGAPSIGFNIRLPHEQQPNPYSTPELTFLFHYFAMRKMHLAMRANALVVFPGGFGTFDELFEILALVQTGKMRRVPVVLFDEGYWRAIVSFEALADGGMIAEDDLSLLQFADTPQGVWELIASAEGIAPYERAVAPDEMGEG